MTGAVESRYPKAARLINEMVAEEINSQDHLESKDITVLLRFASAHSDAIVDVIVLSGGKQWRGSAELATIEPELDRLRGLLGPWLATIQQKAN